MIIPGPILQQFANLYHYLKIDGRYAVAISILPVSFMLLALIPGYFAGNGILNRLGISIDSPVRDLPHPEVWLNAIVLFGTVCLILGALFGVFLNALILLLVCKWGKNETINALVRSKYPDRWLGSPQKQLKADNLRSQARRKGKWHFISVHGVIPISFMANLLMVVAPALVSDSPIRFDILFFLACIWFPIGALYGWAIWKTLVDDE